MPICVKHILARIPPMIDIDNQTDFHPDFSKIEAIADALGAGDIELIICDDAYIHDLNREYRGVDKATDVLSFPYEPMPMAPIGSIVISTAADFSASMKVELKALNSTNSLKLAEIRMLRSSTGKGIRSLSVR